VKPTAAGRRSGGHDGHQKSSGAFRGSCMVDIRMRTLACRGTSTPACVGIDFCGYYCFLLSFLEGYQIMRSDCDFRSPFIVLYFD
jgi:hypothetical protein